MRVDEEDDVTKKICARRSLQLGNDENILLLNDDTLDDKIHVVRGLKQLADNKF